MALNYSYFKNNRSGRWQAAKETAYGVPWRRSRWPKTGMGADISQAEEFCHETFLE
jgi:hypothetical protein